MRRNTQLESAGAEHLVLGHLLRRKIQSFITSQNFEAYDIVAVNPEKNKSVKIQVKSRWDEYASSFPIKKMETDIVIFVKLNCARIQKKQTIIEYQKEPEYYIFDIKTVKKAPKTENWGKIKDLIEIQPNAKDNWELIKQKLELKQ